MSWKFWRWNWWRPPPPELPIERNGVPRHTHEEAQHALRRAEDARDTATRQSFELRELRKAAERQREENHFGHDLYQVMKSRRQQEGR